MDITGFLKKYYKIGWYLTLIGYGLQIPAFLVIPGIWGDSSLFIFYCSIVVALIAFLASTLFMDHRSTYELLYFRFSI